jgi:hypothetical protein
MIAELFTTLNSYLFDQTRQQQKKIKAYRPSYKLTFLSGKKVTNPNEPQFQCFLDILGLEKKILRSVFTLQNQGLIIKKKFRY